MNIQDAKQEIKHTLLAYNRRGEGGDFLFPALRQRPILLMGPPGIGKTAILAQIAQETGVGLVAYTMTHHTRQSAIGLPHIEERTFAGETHTVTSYTMSEIVSAVYQCMERTGKAEGILFLDEINCVSETLAPTMLQLLQTKTFGTHALPPGWLIVAAGNPPEFNKSVRPFDVATLDRVRTISVTADRAVWEDYARSRGVHGAILSYLAIHPEHFYLVELSTDGPAFVTARGWEDLSELLKGYEALDIPVSKELVFQYLQKEEVAAAFAVYFALYRKYAADYGIARVLAGTLTGEEYEEKAALVRRGGFEERFTAVHLLLAALDAGFADHDARLARVRRLHETLLLLRSFWADKPDASMEQFLARRRESLRVKAEAELLSGGEARLEGWVTERLSAYDAALRMEHIADPAAAFDAIRSCFAKENDELAALAGDIRQKLERAFAFAGAAFGEGQELLLLTSSLSRSQRAMAFVAANGSDAFLRHSEVLLYKEQEAVLRAECQKLLEL